MNYCTQVAGLLSYGQNAYRALIVALVLLACVTAKSHSRTRSYFRAGLRNSGDRPIAANQLQKLLVSLRQKTGLIEMKFDSDGFLDIGDHNHVEGGSATARALML